MAQLLAGSKVDGKLIATTDQIPTKTSDLSNDSGFKKITIASSAPSGGVEGDIWIQRSS